MRMADIEYYFMSYDEKEFYYSEMENTIRKMMQIIKLS